MIKVNSAIVDDRTYEYALERHGKPITYADAISLWQIDIEFRTKFIRILENIPFTAYRWETPPVSTRQLNRTFQFALTDAPELVRRPDRTTFAEHFSRADHKGVVVFDNLGKDAVLVVPTPLTEKASYEHLAAFIRSAPEPQKHSLWRTVGQTLETLLSIRPRWVSTAGDGVAWLHIRLDTRPKFYRYSPYRNAG